MRAWWLGQWGDNGVVSLMITFTLKKKKYKKYPLLIFWIKKTLYICVFDKLIIKIQKVIIIIIIIIIDTIYTYGIRFMMNVIYYQVKMLIGFWHKRNLKLGSNIQQQRILTIELIRTYHKLIYCKIKQKVTLNKSIISFQTIQLICLKLLFVSHLKK